MKKIDLPLVADVAFYGSAVWFLSIGILRYLRIGLALSSVLATLFALAAAGAVLILEYRFRHKRRLGKKEAQERDNLLLHLALEKEERILSALLSAFLADEKEATLTQDGILIDGNLYIPRFTMQPLSADEIAKLIRTYGKKECIVVCNALTPEADKLALSFGIKTMKRDEVYALFTRTHTTPAPLITDDLPRKTVKRAMRRIFSKGSARPFFTSGILLLFMSLFTFFPVYYLVTGSILLCLAVGVRFFGFSAPET